MSEARHDEGYAAAVFGAGPAGLAAALTLSRSLPPTVVFDSPTPFRNRDSPGVGAVLGRDLTLPGDLRGLGRQEIAAYGYARFIEAAVVGLEHDAAGFTIATGDGGTIHAKTVVLACGMVDIFADLPGLAQFWGTSVVNCPSATAHV